MPKPTSRHANYSSWNNNKNKKLNNNNKCNNNSSYRSCCIKFMYVSSPTCWCSVVCHVAASSYSRSGLKQGAPVLRWAAHSATHRRAAALRHAILTFERVLISTEVGCGTFLFLCCWFCYCFFFVNTSFVCHAVRCCILHIACTNSKML